MDAVTTYEDYLQSYAKSVNRFQSLMILAMVLLAIVADIFFLPVDTKSPEWYVFYNSCFQFVVCLAAYVLMEKGIFYKYFSPLAYVRVLAFSFGMITWVGCVLNLNLIQVVYVPLMFIGYAMSMLKFSDYFFFGTLTLMSYFLGRTDYIYTDFKAQVWLSFDLLVLFIGLLMVVVLINRLRAHREFFNAIQTIYDQKQKSFYAAKMLSLGEMAGGMAHEINNPLMILSGLNHKVKTLAKKILPVPNSYEQNVHSIIKEDSQNTQGKLSVEKNESSKIIIDIVSATEEIGRNIQRIAKIITSLREFSKIETDETYKEILLNAMIEMTVSLINSRYQESNIKLSYELSPSKVMVLGTESKISQVLFQLLLNSLEAVQSLPEKWVHIKVTVDAGSAFVDIIDSGKGIPTDLQEKIMQPFFTTKEVGKGTGLGLSTSIGMMESMNGKLELISEAKNTNFRLTFPLLKDKNEIQKN